MRKLSILGLICLLVFAYCKSPADPKIEEALSPIIESFSAAPKSIVRGEASQLSWTVLQAKSIEIDQGIGRVLKSGTKWVWPEETTTFTLTATNETGQTQKSCTVEVTLGHATVVMKSKPTYGMNSLEVFIVGSSVKNIGNIPALNVKVSIELWGCYGNLLASGECMVGGEGFILEPQAWAGWEIRFYENGPLLLREMDSTSQILWKITWDE